MCVYVRALYMKIINQTHMRRKRRERERETEGGGGAVRDISI